MLLGLRCHARGGVLTAGTDNNHLLGRHGDQCNELTEKYGVLRRNEVSKSDDAEEDQDVPTKRQKAGDQEL